VLSGCLAARGPAELTGAREMTLAGIVSSVPGKPLPRSFPSSTRSCQNRRPSLDSANRSPKGEISIAVAVFSSRGSVIWSFTFLAFLVSLRSSENELIAG